jgi:copper chaperone CopZ
MTIKTFLIEGMICKNCKSYMENTIKNIAGVEDVIADLANGQVRVSGHEIDNNEIKHSVEESGYIFRGEAHNMARNSDVWLG